MLIPFISSSSDSRKQMKYPVASASFSSDPTCSTTSRLGRTVIFKMA